MRATYAIPVGRTMAVVGVGALLLWAAGRVVLGTSAVPVSIAHQPHFAAPVTAPSTAAPSARQPVAGDSAPAKAGPSTAAQPQQPSNAQAVPSNPPSGCLLTGSNVPVKSTIRGGCPAN